MLTLLISSGALAGNTCAALEARVEAALTTGPCATVALGRVRFLYADDPCLAQVLTHRGLGQAAEGLPPSGGRLPPPGGKETRNVYMPATDASMESENFILRYGVLGLDEGHLQAMLDTFEAAWEEQIEVQGWPAPRGTDTFKFNVYVDQTSSGPRDTGPFVAAYYSTDALGYPLIVMGKNQLGRASAAGVATHELHHAVQGAFQSLEYADDAAWWFEATAVWMEHMHYGDVDAHAGNLGAFAKHPDLSLAYYEDIAEGDPTESYAYGAFVFPRFVELEYGAEAIRAVWDRARPGNNPLRLLDDELSEVYGVAAVDWIGAFAGRNATWDYPEERGYEDAIQDWDDPTGTWPTGAVAVPTEGLVEAQRGRPSNLGANYWEIVDVPQRMSVRFEGQEADAWAVVVSGTFDGAHERTVIEVGTDGVGDAVVEGYDAADDVWLVISPVDGLKDRGEIFDYAFSLSEAAVEIEEEDVAGCACASGRGRGGLVLLLAVAAVMRRRVKGPRSRDGAERSR